jgi:hypothetical protein
MSNIRDANGKLIKTICATDIDQGHVWNRRNCESLNMNMLRIDTPEVETAVLKFANDQYSRFLPGWIYYDGTMGNGRCRCISNEKTGVATNYIKHQCGVDDGNYAMCEFKTARGEFIFESKLVAEQ